MRDNKEHLPELLSVPGILSAARYEAVKGGPKYLPCYELESVAVMQTPAFTNRPRTPWGQKVSPSVIGKNLIGAELQEADLQGANLYHANLTGADLSGAIVTQTQLDQACGTGAKIDPGLTLKPCPN